MSLCVDIRKHECLPVGMQPLYRTLTVSKVTFMHNGHKIVIKIFHLKLVLCLSAVYHIISSAEQINVGSGTAYKKHSVVAFIGFIQVRLDAQLSFC